MQKLCFVVPTALLKCCTPKTHLSLFVKCKPRKVHIGPQLVHGIDHRIGELAKRQRKRMHQKGWLSTSTKLMIVCRNYVSCPNILFAVMKISLRLLS